MSSHQLLKSLPQILFNCISQCFWICVREMSQLSVILQEAIRREREVKTILGFLREQMDSTLVDRGITSSSRRRRRSFKERLGCKGISCCGATWGITLMRSMPISARDDYSSDEEEEADVEALGESNPDPGCFFPLPAPETYPGMNLAAALAAERHFRASPHEPGTPARVSLLRLLEETDGGDLRRMGIDSVCCVCMRREKGAAFIPCGHTFCRVCSRELWLNRGSCPLCNRPILEILDIF